MTKRRAAPAPFQGPIIADDPRLREVVRVVVNPPGKPRGIYEQLDCGCIMAGITDTVPPLRMCRRHRHVAV